MGEIVLIFDGRCGFCTRAARWIRRWDRRGRVRLVPCQRPGAPERYGLTRAQCEEAAWAITPDGGAIGARRRSWPPWAAPSAGRGSFGSMLSLRSGGLRTAYTSKSPGIEGDCPACARIARSIRRSAAR